MRTFSTSARPRGRSRRRSWRLKLFCFGGVSLLVVLSVLVLSIVMNQKGSDTPVNRGAGGETNAASTVDLIRLDDSPDLYELLMEPKLLAAYIHRGGGREKLMALESMQYEGRIRWRGESYSFQLIKHYSNQMRLSLYNDNLTIMFGFDGRSLWKSLSEGGNTRFSLLTKAESGVFIDCIRFLDALKAYALSGEGAVQVIEFDEWQGRTALRVQIRGATGGRTNLYMDPKSLQVSGWVDLERTFAQERVVVYEDYREVAGYSVPFLRRVYVDGGLIYEMAILSCRFNVEVMPSIFEVPNDASHLAL